MANRFGAVHPALELALLGVLATAIISHSSDCRPWPRGYPAPMEIESGSVAAIVPITTVGHDYFVRE